MSSAVFVFGLTVCRRKVELGKLTKSTTLGQINSTQTFTEVFSSGNTAIVCSVAKANNNRSYSMWLPLLLQSKSTLMRVSSNIPFTSELYTIAACETFATSSVISKIRRKKSRLERGEWRTMRSRWTKIHIRKTWAFLLTEHEIIENTLHLMGQTKWLQIKAGFL